LEAIALSERPCVFSHSNPRVRANNPRNITDEQIKACAEAGGVIGVCGWGPTLWTRGAQPPSLDDFVGHIEYMVNLVGLDHVGVASDSTTSMRIDHILQHAAEVNVAYPAVTEDYVSKFGNGLDRRYPVSVAALPSVTARLLERGWKRDDVAKVMGGNFLRIWRTVWG
ncbi:MAG TPA: membrane dipeptidase, partial [bacterium]|nr:membrane dipeptidase [bacterium]